MDTRLAVKAHLRRHLSTPEAEFKRRTKLSNCGTRKGRGTWDEAVGFREFRKFKEMSTCSQEHAILIL